MCHHTCRHDNGRGSRCSLLWFGSTLESPFCRRLCAAIPPPAALFAKRRPAYFSFSQVWYAHIITQDAGFVKRLFLFLKYFHSPPRAKSCFMLCSAALTAFIKKNAAAILNGCGVALLYFAGIVLWFGLIPCRRKGWRRPKRHAR